MAILTTAYCVVAWALPVVVFVVFNELPYLQQRPFLDRLVSSAAGTGTLIAALAIAFPRRFRIYREKTASKTVESVLFGLLGLAMFTAVGAAWSGNLFGVITKLMPGTEYRARFRVTEADGSRRGLSLSLQQTEGTKVAYLTLSRRLFGRPRIEVGDELVLIGKQNWAGVYVDDVELR